MAAPSDGRAAANRPVQSRQRACTPCPCPSLTSHTATLAHTQRARAIRLSTAATMRTVDMAALLWAVLAWVAIGERGGRATAHFFFFDLDPPACTPPSFLLAPLPTLSRFSSSLAPHPSPPPPPKHARPRPTPSPPSPPPPPLPSSAATPRASAFLFPAPVPYLHWSVGIGWSMPLKCPPPFGPPPPYFGPPGPPGPFYGRKLLDSWVRGREE